MVVALLAVIGCVVGYRLEMTRAGYVTISLTAIGSSAAQIIHLLMTEKRESITMLPLAMGLVLVLCMFVGALVRVNVSRGTRT